MTPEEKKIYMKEWRKKNKEKIIAYEKKYQEENKVAIAEMKRIYNAKNKEVIAEKKKIYHEKNKEIIAKKHKEFHLKNRDKLNQRALDYYNKNRDMLLARQADWREKNRDLSRQAAKNWQKNNKPKVLASMSKRRSAKINRTPSWLTAEQLLRIESLYAESIKRRQETGLDWHVDHIIPLQGKLVSGLHVPENMQIILAQDNVRKGNRYQL
jgi:hypothetical protein